MIDKIIALLLFSQGFMVQPGRIEVEVAGGQTITKKLIITNISSDTIFIRTHVEKFDQDTTGKIVFYKTYDQNTVTINPLEFYVPPGDNKTVRITLKTPFDMPNEIWGMIIFSQLPPPLEQYTTIKFVREIGVPFYLIPIGAMGELDVDTSFVKNDSVFFVLHNTGLRHIRGEGIFRIETDKGELIREKEVKSIFILPERKTVKAFSIKSLPAGIYVAKFRVKFGGPYAIEGVKSFKKE